MTEPASPGVDTEEQAALRQSVAALLDKRSDPAAVRAAIASEHGHDPALWSMLVEQIGAAALSIPERYDGAGATWVETHLVCEELGRRLTPSPLLGSAVLAAQAVLASGDEAACARILPGIAAGDQVALCWASQDGWASPGVGASGGDGDHPSLSGTAHHVLGADTASTLLVVAITGGQVGLFEVPSGAAGLTVTRVPVMDPTRTMARVDFESVSATPIRTRPSFLARLRAAGWAAISAEQVGAARAALDATVRYTKERTQFGRAIGSFQALKHRMADMYVRAETAASLSYSAAARVAQAQALGEGPEADEAAYAAEIEAAAAKVYCSEAVQWITGEAIQLHGGVGITWEYDVQLYFKRAHGTAQLLGQPHEILAALEVAAGL
ncbi:MULTISPECIES: acyl-CoA dehydrogenase family protein [unclassified Dietzia]|uniref:acyl-CoA dehydrogenase family protein n=1 Tax=unclassified Dietzia TaxID=2617939 RepID=UPI000D20DB1A|nr:MULTISPECIES: acyl-CoA dehydrogenase family protein [unclassified Dietzia]AVZ38639.1 acyl-CoA dehydrogenase [Dietzia sp. JS16-p6b]QGW23721.1 acyl-CoA dehydrogenase [Dietzia sp. DQ12-45-1b]